MVSDQKRSIGSLQNLAVKYFLLFGCQALTFDALLFINIPVEALI